VAVGVNPGGDADWLPDGTLDRKPAGVEFGFDALDCRAHASIGQADVLRLFDELDGLTPAAVERALGGLPEERRHAATLVVEAIRAAATHFRGRPAPVVSRV
jgi:hypothetical protein